MIIQSFYSIMVIRSPHKGQALIHKNNNQKRIRKNNPRHLKVAPPFLRGIFFVFFYQFPGMNPPQADGARILKIRVWHIIGLSKLRIDFFNKKNKKPSIRRGGSKVKIK